MTAMPRSKEAQKIVDAILGKQSNMIKGKKKKKSKVEINLDYQEETRSR
jgi:hypothetical protein